MVTVYLLCTMILQLLPPFIDALDVMDPEKRNEKSSFWIHGICKSDQKY